MSDFCKDDVVRVCCHRTIPDGTTAKVVSKSDHGRRNFVLIEYDSKQIWVWSDCLSHLVSRDRRTMGQDIKNLSFSEARIEKGQVIFPSVQSASAHFKWLIEESYIGRSIDRAASECSSEASKTGKWNDFNYGDIKKESVIGRLDAIKSCLSGAGEHYRTKDRSELRELTADLADALVRILDLAGALSLALGSAVEAKLEDDRNQAHLNQQLVD